MKRCSVGQKKLSKSRKIEVYLSIELTSIGVAKPQFALGRNPRYISACSAAKTHRGMGKALSNAARIVRYVWKNSGVFGFAPCSVALKGKFLE